MRLLTTVLAVTLTLPMTAFAVITDHEVSTETTAESWSEIVCTKKPDGLCTVKQPPPRATTKMPFGIRAPLRATASFEGTGIVYSTPVQARVAVAQQ